jgi:murein DD-endopeptidase MepM/ murein hydrolase activator NlpD
MQANARRTHASAWLALISIVLSGATASAAIPWLAPTGGGAATLPAEEPPDPAVRAAIEARIEIAGDALRAARAPLRGGGAPAPPAFAWPLRVRADFPHPSYFGVSNFVDHDLSAPNHLLDWACGQRSYDTGTGYNHAGTDIFLWPFAWSKMFDEEIEIVAAAPGTIVGKDDGHFDGNCSFNSEPWNAVYVRHVDGSVAWYGHMKLGSTTPKPVGASVATGERLGLVGSSGSSTMPHLHFEVHDAANQVIDPFAGACRTGASWWADQPPYYDSTLNQISTHDAVPDTDSCNEAEATHLRARFDPGQTVYFATFYHDQLAGQVTMHTVRRPDGTPFSTWQGSSPEPHYPASYWYWALTLPQDAPLGTWTFEANYLGQQEVFAFTVPEPDAMALGAVALLALGARSLRRA